MANSFVLGYSGITFIFILLFVWGSLLWKTARKNRQVGKETRCDKLKVTTS